MNYLKYGLVVVIVAAMAYAIAYVGVTYLIAPQSLGSAVGSTFNTAKIVAVDMSPATSAASTTSILNTDASARWLDSAVVACTGVAASGTSLPSNGFTVQAATSTIAGAGLAGNTNLALNIIVSTTTPFSQNASSTVAAGVSTNTDLYYWPSGTYLNFLFSGINTAACVVKMGYTPS